MNNKNLFLIGTKREIADLVIDACRENDAFMNMELFWKIRAQAFIRLYTKAFVANRRHAPNVSWLSFCQGMEPDSLKILAEGYLDDMVSDYLKHLINSTPHDEYCQKLLYPITSSLTMAFEGTAKK